MRVRVCCLRFATSAKLAEMRNEVVVSMQGGTVGVPSCTRGSRLGPMFPRVVMSIEASETCESESDNFFFKSMKTLGGTAKSGPTLSVASFLIAPRDEKTEAHF